MKATWTNNLALKIVSLVAAVLVWNLIRTEPTSISAIRVPLQYGPPPQELELTGEFPDTILIRVRGPEAALRDLTAERIPARIELSDLTIGQQFIAVTEDNFQLPSGLEVERIDPDLISLHVERKLERPVLIEPAVTGEVAQGFELVRIVLSPDRLQVEGPETEVRKIQSLRTGSLDISGRRETFSQAVSVVTENSAVRLPQGRSALATVEIREVPEERGFFGIPVLVENATGAASVQPATLGVVVMGPRSKMADLSAANFLIVVNAVGLEPRKKAYTVSPEVSLMPPSLALFLEVTGLSQESVSLRLAAE
jgi:YbbR domain-containing protein